MLLRFSYQHNRKLSKTKVCSQLVWTRLALLTKRRVLFWISSYQNGLGDENMWGSYFLNGSFPRALYLVKIFYYWPGKKVYSFECTFLSGTAWNLFAVSYFCYVCVTCNGRNIGWEVESLTGIAATIALWLLPVLKVEVSGSIHGFHVTSRRPCWWPR